MMKKLILVVAPLFLAACVTEAPIRQPLPQGVGTPQAPQEETAQSGPLTQELTSGAFIPDEDIQICPGLRVQNAPVSDRNGRVTGYERLVVVRDRIVMAPIPLNGACISSGYGQRNGRLHKGIDISAPRGTWVYAAAPGIVLEAGWGGGYGNYVLVDHGLGVVTRYAHLDTFVEGIAVGDELGFGWPLGQVGNTSSQRIGGPHLHFEVLTGNYNTPRKAFGMAGNDPLSFPVYQTPAPAS